MKRFMCVIAVGMMLMISQGQGFAQEKKPAGYKDPNAAALWGYILPGAGHVYAGESGKGFVLMVGSVGALAAGTIVTLNSGDESAEVGYDYDFSVGETNWTPFYIGGGAFALGWIYSVMDAGKAAERTNKKKGLSLRSARVEPYVAGRGAGKAWGIRLSIAL